MIKKFIDKLLGKSAEAPRFGKRQEVAASVHGIDPALVDERAKNVVTTFLARSSTSAGSMPWTEASTSCRLPKRALPPEPGAPDLPRSLSMNVLIIRRWAGPYSFSSMDRISGMVIARWVCKA